MIRNREMLLKEIQELAFRMKDLNLFLDTHPTEQSAIELYNQTLNKYNAMVCNFEKLYGPLTMRTTNVFSTNDWLWLKGPWPWENNDFEEECK